MINYFSLATIICLALMGYVLILLAPTKTTRFLVIPGVFLVLALHVGAVLAWLGQPIGMDRPPVNATVLASYMVQGEGIYLWLDTGKGAPEYVVLPWNDERANELIEAQRLGESAGTVTVVGSGGDTESDQPMFYPAPVMPLPEKQGT